MNDSNRQRATRTSALWRFAFDYGHRHYSEGIALTPRLTMLGAPDMIKKMKIVASERKL